MNNKKSYFFTCILFFFIIFTSCRKQLNRKEIQFQNKELIENLIHTGRQNQSPHMKKMPSLSLTTHEPISNIYYANQNKYVSNINFDTSKMESLVRNDLKEYSLKFISDRYDLFFIKKDQLIEADRFIINPSKNMTTLVFSRLYNKYKVRDAFISLTFIKNNQKNTYTLRDIKNNTYGEIEINTENLILPSEHDFSELTGWKKELIMKRIDYIYPSSEKNKITFLPASRFLVKRENSTELLSITITANEMKIIEAYSNRYYTSHKFTAKVNDRNYFEDELTDSPLSFFFASPSELSDANGVLTNETQISESTFTLSGQRAVVLDGSVSTEEEIIATNINITADYLENNQISLEATSTKEQSALNALNHIQDINTLTRKHINQDESEILSSSMLAVVNYSDSCNAYYSNESSQPLLVFYSEGTAESGITCANTGLLADIVVHEWCHGLNDKTAQEGVLDLPFSEGIADVCSAFLLDTAELGVGLILDDTEFIRTLDNDISYNESITIEDPHEEGLIIASTFWHLREELIKRYGKEKGTFKAERYFFRHLLNTNFYKDSYQAVLTLDDDDLNPETKSPNYCLINDVFARHGLADLEEDCSDEVDAITLEKNTDLFLGLEHKIEQNTYKWLVSGTEIAKIDVCIGEEVECQKSQKIDFSLEYYGKNNNRDFFISKESFTLKSFQELTVYATDYFGNKTYRTFTVSPR